MELFLALGLPIVLLVGLTLLFMREGIPSWVQQFNSSESGPGWSGGGDGGGGDGGGGDGGGCGGDGGGCGGDGGGE